jgi:hypothetical protein
MIFYKAVPVTDLRQEGYIPGTVTRSYNEAYTWWERYNSTKKNPKGPARHIKRSPAVVIKFVFTEDLLSAVEFQREGVREHDRRCCWTSGDKVKAQINKSIQNWEVVLAAPQKF